jgi:flagellar basal-body rod protein FlgC
MAIVRTQRGDSTMSLINAYHVGASALTAQGMRENTVASNLANVDSAASSTDSLYKSRHVVFESYVLPNGGTGVRVRDVIESNAEPRVVHDPAHPLADAQGNVAYPNVNAVHELADMISASRAYQTNVEMMNTIKTMLQRTLSLGQS